MGVIGHAQTCPKKLLKTEKRENGFVRVVSYLYKLYIYSISFAGYGQACPGMQKEDFKTLIYQKQGNKRSCACNFISI